MSPFNIFASLSLATLLASCGQSSAPGETVESLAADPERLKELRQQCKHVMWIFGESSLFHKVSVLCYVFISTKLSMKMQNLS